MIRSTLITFIFFCLVNYGFSQKLIKTKTKDKGSITITGVASDGKWSGVLFGQDSVLYYLEDGTRWDEQYLNKTIIVVGNLILEKRKYQVEKNDEGEIIYSAVLPKRMLIIESPSVTLTEE